MTTLTETANAIRDTEIGQKLLARLDAIEQADAEFDRVADEFRAWMDEQAQKNAEARNGAR